MTLYYNMLAQRLPRAPGTLGINAFCPLPGSGPRQAERARAPQMKFYHYLNEGQPQSNSFQEDKTEPVKGEQRRNQTVPEDEFRVISEAVIPCDNKPYPLEALSGVVIAKVPVVLAGFTLQLNLDSHLFLPEAVKEIRQNKKNVKITQCKLMPDTNILFIRGTICRNIEYSSEPSNLEKIRHWYGETPFNCTTSVSFNGGKPAPAKASTSCGLEYFGREELPGTRLPPEEDTPSCDVSELNQISTVFYNEMPFCELVESKIVEMSGKRALNCLEEKMIVYLTLRILQYQQVAINAGQA